MFQDPTDVAKVSAEYDTDVATRTGAFLITANGVTTVALEREPLVHIPASSPTAVADGILAALQLHYVLNIEYGSVAKPIMIFLQVGFFRNSGKVTIDAHFVIYR